MTPEEFRLAGHRLIDFLLREEIGRETPPNLTQRIMRAADRATRKQPAVKLSRWRVPAMKPD